MSIESINLNELTVEQLNDVIKKARELKSKKATPSIKVNAYVSSVSKHVDAALQAIKKLSDAQGVPQKKWDEVENQLRRLQIDAYRESATKVKVSERGGRRRAKKA